MAKEKLSLEELFLNYTVHKDGTVIKNRNGARMSPQVRKGYLAMGFSVNNKKRRMMVHRLVAIVHIPNPNNYPEVNHVDCNKLNPHYTNLEWCTPEQNNEHAIKNGLIKYGPRLYSIELVDKAIELFSIGLMPKKVAEFLDLNINSIYKIKRTYFCCQLRRPNEFLKKHKPFQRLASYSDEYVFRINELHKTKMSIMDIAFVMKTNYARIWYILNRLPKKEQYAHLKFNSEAGQLKLNLF